MWRVQSMVPRATSLSRLVSGRGPALWRACCARRASVVGQNRDGDFSHAYPALASVPADLLGVCVAGTSGAMFAAGDANHEFAIMSVSKPFVFPLGLGLDLLISRPAQR
jgi:hypothetical protein